MAVPNARGLHLFGATNATVLWAVFPGVEALVAICADDQIYCCAGVAKLDEKRAQVVLGVVRVSSYDGDFGAGFEQLRKLWINLWVWIGEFFGKEVDAYGLEEVATHDEDEDRSVDADPLSRWFAQWFFEMHSDGRRYVRGISCA